jgi:phospholipase/carboxylesterase
MKSPLIYTIHLPPALEPDQKYPAVFALHGIGYNEQDILSAVVDLKERFILIGIRGHLAHNGGFAYYTLKEYGKPDRDKFDQSIAMLKEFIAFALGQYPVDPQQMFLLGFSQGAILSMSLALILGNSVKGVAAMNGYIPAFVKEEFAIKPINKVSFFLSDGEWDHIFPPRIGKENYEYLSQYAKSVQYKTYPSGHEISAENRRDVAAWLRSQIPS